jgi:2-methylaconitate cis-trans-isomerase PrpF
MTLSELKQKFPIGSRVKVFDEEDGGVVYGTVINAKEPCVLVVKWDDLSSDCAHDESEIKDIKPA